MNAAERIFGQGSVWSEGLLALMAGETPELRYEPDRVDACGRCARCFPASLMVQGACPGCVLSATERA